LQFYQETGWIFAAEWAAEMAAQHGSVQCRLLNLVQHDAKIALPG